jgi:homoserine kinase type II
VQAALGTWPLPGAWTLRPSAAGTNNLSCFVDTPAGAYFLRIYRNTADTQRIRYEHALLLALQHSGLPFAVPRPLTTRQGATYASLEYDGERIVAALFPVIVGEHPRRRNAAQALVSGEALAVLDAALARISIDPALPPLTPYGDLGQVHPLVPDPLAMIARLPVRAEQQARLRVFFDELLSQIPGLYGRLPQQIIHADCGRGNILLHEGRVSGCLDFEFALPDLRALDFAAALWSFGIAPYRTARDWAVIDAFVVGYSRQQPLTSTEAEALPTLLRLREATSLVHWVGRLRQGLTTVDDIMERVEDLLRVDRWLRTYAADLVRRVVRAICA